MPEDLLYVDSMEHYTTAVQGQRKVMRMDAAPVAAVGAFGQPGQNDDYTVNFANNTTIVLHGYFKPDLLFTRRLLNFNNMDGLQLAFTQYSDGTWGFSRSDLVPIAATPANAVQGNVQHSAKITIVFSDTVGKVDIEIDGISKLSTAANLDTNSNATGGCSQLHFTESTGIWSCIAIAKGPIAGQPRVQAVFATADSADETMTQVGGTAGDAFTTINETSPNDATYLEGDAANERNSFQYANALATTDVILGVAANPMVWKPDADVRTGRPYVMLNAGTGMPDAAGTRFYGPTVGVPGSPAYLQHIWQMNPATGVAWTVAQVNAPLLGGWEDVI